MRYWIWWNDLVQGPFEIHELRSLSAFTAELLVCEESRQDWAAVGTIPELGYYLQSVVTVEPPPPAPPPPPDHPPTLVPLQGEFIIDPPSEQTLFDSNGHTHFAYRPAVDAPEPTPAEELPHPVTAPFHFTVVLPRPENQPEIATVERQPLPTVNEQTALLPETDRGALEPEPQPEMTHVLQNEFKAVIDTIPGDAVEQMIPQPSAADILKVIEPPITVPAPAEEVIQERTSIRKPSLLPWVLAVFLLFGVLGSGVFFWSAHKTGSSKTGGRSDQGIPTLPDGSAAGTPPANPVTDLTSGNSPTSMANGSAAGMPLQGRSLSGTGSNAPSGMQNAGAIALGATKAPGNSASAAGQAMLPGQIPAGQSVAPQKPSLLKRLAHLFSFGENPTSAGTSTTHSAGTGTAATPGASNAAANTPSATGQAALSGQTSSEQSSTRQALPGMKAAGQPFSSSGNRVSAGSSVTNPALAGIGARPGTTNAAGNGTSAAGQAALSGQMPSGQSASASQKPSLLKRLAHLFSFGQNQTSAANSNASTTMNPAGVAASPSDSTPPGMISKAGPSSAKPGVSSMSKAEDPTGAGSASAERTANPALRSGAKLPSQSGSSAPSSALSRSLNSAQAGAGSSSNVQAGASSSENRRAASPAGTDASGNAPAGANPRTDHGAASGATSIAGMAVPSGMGGASESTAGAGASLSANASSQVAAKSGFIPTVKTAVSTVIHALSSWWQRHFGAAETAVALTPIPATGTSVASVNSSSGPGSESVNTHSSEAARAGQNAGYDASGQYLSAGHPNAGEISAGTSAGKKTMTHPKTTKTASTRPKVHKAAEATYTDEFDEMMAASKTGSASGLPAARSIQATSASAEDSAANTKTDGRTHAGSRSKTSARSASAATAASAITGTPAGSSSVGTSSENSSSPNNSNASDSSENSAGKSASSSEGSPSPSSKATGKENTGAAMVTKAAPEVASAQPFPNNFRSPGGSSLDDSATASKQAAQAGASGASAAFTAIPGVSATSPSALNASVNGKASASTIKQEPPKPPDPWGGKEQSAINLVLNTKIYSGQRTVGSNAKLMLEDMHERELLHAADTGERLYLPDKMNTMALHEQGPAYRVYFDFLAWQPSGERVRAVSYQFGANLQTRKVIPDDKLTQHDFFEPKAMLIHKHNPKADDIENVLEAVDNLNKHKVDSIIERTRDQQKQLQNALKIAATKFQKTLFYFRSKYVEQTLQNIAKAYNFLTLVNEK